MYIFVFLTYVWDAYAYLTVQGDKDVGIIHNVMRRFLPLILGSQASKSHV